MVSCAVCSQSCLSLYDPLDGVFCPWDFSGKNTGVGCHFLLQGIFLGPETEPASLVFPALLVDSWPAEPLESVEGGSQIHPYLNLNSILFLLNHSLSSLVLYRGNGPSKISRSWNRMTGLIKKPTHQEHGKKKRRPLCTVKGRENWGAGWFPHCKHPADSVPPWGESTP